MLTLHTRKQPLCQVPPCPTCSTTKAQSLHPTRPCSCVAGQVLSSDTFPLGYPSKGILLLNENPGVDLHAVSYSSATQLQELHKSVDPKLAVVDGALASPKLASAAAQRLAISLQPSRASEGEETMRGVSSGTKAHMLSQMAF